MINMAACASKEDSLVRFNSDGSRIKPEIYENTFDENSAEDTGFGLVDLSKINDGYFGVSTDYDKKLKLQVYCGDETYNYDLESDGKPYYFPLNMGSGIYIVKLLENISETKYAEVWSNTFTVELNEEYLPFLRANRIVEFTADSECVDFTWELTKDCKDEMEIISAVYSYVADNISYDYEKAQTVESGYLPDPDSTLEEKKGICFDFAALVSAMLRSQGIPCQLITGYFGDDLVYHAWNRIYTSDSGWITYEISASADDWNRVDITLASTGKNAELLTDDTNYTTRHIY